MAGIKSGMVAKTATLNLDPPAAVIASAGPSSKLSIASENSMASIPTECRPKARAPAGAPGPTALINIKARTISGKDLMKVKTIFPLSDTQNFLCRVLAAQKAKGTEMMAEIKVPKKAIHKVCHNWETRSSPLPL